jgi:hypothetical protein
MRRLLARSLRSAARRLDPPKPTGVFWDLGYLALRQGDKAWPSGVVIHTPGNIAFAGHEDPRRGLYRSRG